METKNIFTYWWGFEDTPEEGLVISIYGLDENNDSILLRVVGFKPYIYVELGLEKWTQSILKSISEKWRERYKNINTIKFVKKKRLYYNHKTLVTNGSNSKEWQDELFPFLHVSFDRKIAIYGFEKDVKYNNFVDCIQKKIQIKIHENNASPILQYVCQQDLPTANWIQFKGKRVPKNSQISSCDYEYICSSINLKRVTNMNIVPNACIMAFDIEANSTNPDKMPNAKLSGDKIFQISCSVGRVGDKEPRHNILITLGNVNHDLIDPKIEVYECNHEGDVLLCFTQIIQKYNPHVITGYNIFSFDLPYMIERSKLCNVFHDFTIQGYTDACAIEKEIKWSSTAYKNQSFKYLDTQGRLYVDMLPIIQRDYKLDNYKLKTVSDLFVGETKDPLTAKDIFKCYRLGTKICKTFNEQQVAKNAISIVGKYCIQDSVLVFKLFNNLQTWVGLVEMATTCNVPIFTLYTQGQQIKVFSQIYKECLEKNYVVEKDGYVAKDDERLTGAMVLEPIPGIYDKITPFDFTSLYPTTIIAYNLCFSTLVRNDDPIDDKYCHVININEHKNCIAEGSMVSLYNTSVPIEKLYNLSTVLSWDGNKLIYSNATNWYNQGKKECIRLEFDNGRHLTCTPDHKILSLNRGWIEAGELNVNDIVQCGIMYPKNVCDDTTFNFYIDDTLSFCTRSQYELDKFMAYSRLLGFLNLDGTRYQYIIRTKSRMDADAIIRDVRIVTGEIVEYNDDNTIHIPLSFHKNIMHNYMVNGIPFYLLNEKCPVPIMTEFLGGLFSHSSFDHPNIVGKNVVGVSISSKNNLNWIKHILKSLYNIDATIQDNVLSVDKMSVRDFYTDISYRYNTCKQYKLEIIVNYMRYIAKHKKWYSIKHMSFQDYLHKVGCSIIFQTFHLDNIPTYYTRIVKTYFAGIYRVYDINVSSTSSFVCNSIVVHNCDHDTTTVKKDTKNITCQDYRYRFLKEPKGIVPTLLEDLLNARTHTKNQQKLVKKELDIATDEKKQELQLLYNVLEKRQLAYKVSANSVYGAYGTRRGYLPFLPGAQCTTALGRMNILRAGKYIQEHYKAKLVYGDSVTGDTPILYKLNNDSINISEIQHLGQHWVSYEQYKSNDVNLRDKEQCFLETPLQIWTSNGWRLIKRIVRHKTNKRLFSVLTSNGYITVTEDHSLLQKDTLVPVTPDTVNDMNILLHHDWPLDVYEFDILSSNKMENKQIDKNNAYLIGFISGSELNGNILVSPYVSYLETICKIYDIVKRKNTISIEIDNEFVEFWKLCTYKTGVPFCILNADYTIKTEYIKGYMDANNGIIMCTSLILAQGIYYLLKSLGISELTLVKTQYGITISQVYTPNVYTTIVDAGISDGFVYDIETEDGTFHAGVGELIVKNTDSVYVKFPVQSKETFENLWDFCEKVESEINSLFIKPIHLSFENAIYDRFFILTKKRYVCLKADRNGKISDKLMIRGVLLTRRDNAPLIRDIYKKTIMCIFYKEDETTIVDMILEHIQKMFTRQHDLCEYIITKSIGDITDYKVKSLSEDEKKREKRLKDLKCTTEQEYMIRALPANIQLAEKMRRRGKLVSASQRIEYVITNPKNHLAKQFDKIEDVDYVREHSDIIQIDPLYYLKLMSKSMDEVLLVGLKLNNLVIKQYKYRLLKHKLIDELHEYFGNNYRILTT